MRSTTRMAMSHRPLPRDRRLLQIKKHMARGAAAVGGQARRVAGVVGAQACAASWHDRQTLALRAKCTTVLSAQQCCHTFHDSLPHSCHGHPATPVHNHPAATPVHNCHATPHQAHLNDSWPGVSMTSRPGSFRSNWRPLRSSSVRVSTAPEGERHY